MVVPITEMAIMASGIVEEAGTLEKQGTEESVLDWQQIIFIANVHPGRQTGIGYIEIVGLGKMLDILQ